MTSLKYSSCFSSLTTGSRAVCVCVSRLSSLTGYSLSAPSLLPFLYVHHSALTCACFMRVFPSNKGPRSICDFLINRVHIDRDRGAGRWPRAGLTRPDPPDARRGRRWVHGHRCPSHVAPCSCSQLGPLIRAPFPSHPLSSRFEALMVSQPQRSIVIDRSGWPLVGRARERFTAQQGL